MDVLLLAIAIVLFLLMFVFSFCVAYHITQKEEPICLAKKENENEVSLDDICEKYLKLTNLN